MSKIIHWTIKITWSDGEEEYLSDIPDAIAKPTAHWGEGTIFNDYEDILEITEKKHGEVTGVYKIKNNKMELSGNSDV
jgi:hypothetical protein